MLKIEERLFQYPKLSGQVAGLKSQIKLLKEQITTKKTLLDDVNKYSTDEYKNSLISSLQDNEKQLLYILDLANSLELEEVLIKSSLEILSDLEKEIVIMYYFKDMDIADIADKLTYSYSWIHKLKAISVIKLSKALGESK